MKTKLNVIGVIGLTNTASVVVHDIFYGIDDVVLCSLSVDGEIKSTHYATLVDGDKFFVDKLECSLNDCIRN